MEAKHREERSWIEREERQGSREERGTMIELMRSLMILIVSEILVQSRSLAFKDVLYLVTLVETRSHIQEQGTRFVK